MSNDVTQASPASPGVAHSGEAGQDQPPQGGRQRGAGGTEPNDACVSLVDRRFVGWLAARGTRLALFAFLALSIGLPAIYLFVAAVSSAPPTSPERSFTWANLKTVYASDRYLDAMLNTLHLALPVAVLSTVFALILGLLHAYATPYAPRFLRAMQMAPIFISPLVSTVGWVALASPGAGLLNRVLDPLGLPETNIFGFNGAILVLTTIYTPYAFVFVSEAISRIGADVYEAAQVAGANGLGILFKVTIPQLAPALFSGFVFTFVMACEIYSVPSILLAPDRNFVLANVIFRLTTGWPLDYQTAAAIGTLLLLVSTIGFALHAWATRMEGRYVTQAGKSTRPVVMTSNRRSRSLSTIFIGAFITLSVGLPLAGVIVRALAPYFSADLSWSMFGFDNFEVIRSNPATLTAIKNSFLLGGAAMLLAIIVGGLVGYTTVRRRGALSKAVQFLANLPMGFPGTVLAVALVWTYIRTPMYGSIYILVIAVFFGSLPMVARINQNSVLQSSQELEDAADTAGASLFRRATRIQFPQFRSSLLMGALLAFVFAVNEVSAAKILSTGSTAPISVMIYDYLEDAKYGYAAVLSIVQGLITATVAMVLVLLAASNWRRKPRDKPSTSAPDLIGAHAAVPDNEM